MTYKELAGFYRKRLIEYEVKQDYSFNLANWGAMVDTVNYLIENSENKDRKLASDIVYTFCVGSFDKIIGKNKRIISTVVSDDWKPNDRTKTKSN